MVHLPDAVFPRHFTVVIFQFVFSWNDFFGPLVAMSLLSIVPLILVFVVFQRYFVRSLATTGLK